MLGGNPWSPVMRKILGVIASLFDVVKFTGTQRRKGCKKEGTNFATSVLRFSLGSLTSS